MLSLTEEDPSVTETEDRQSTLPDDAPNPSQSSVLSPQSSPVPSGSRWPSPRPGRAMGLGLMVPISEGSAFGSTPRFADMLAITRTADAVGFDAVWFADHLVFELPEGSAPRGIWECWTTMAGLAAATNGSAIQIGCLVACTGFRNPGVIVKMAEAIDEIGQGRFILGLGAGWHEPEYRQFGFPFDHRVGRFEEAIGIIHGMLRDGRADLDGKFSRAEGMLNLPRGPRAETGGPPILIGSSGPRMLGLLARYADAWNSGWQQSAEDVKPKLDALDAACRAAGRDPASVVRTAGANIALPGYLGVRPNAIDGDEDALADAIRAFRALGIDHFVCGLDPCTPESVAWFAGVIARLDKDDAG